MARQKGIIKLKGTIGDVSFYKSKDGYLAREKGGVDGDRIKNDPAFQRTRENGSEFGRAGAAGKVLRNALRLLLQNASDAKVTSRLTKQMLQVIKSDGTNARGERTIALGDVSYIQGFEFNINGKLGSTLYAAFQAAINRGTGACTVTIPQFVPANTVAYPTGATHMRFLVGVAAIDFETEAFEFSQAASADLVIGQAPVNQLDLAVNVSANSELDIFLVLGIDFMQEVNGAMYPLKNGSYNPLAIVAIDRYVAP
jgi:hypothetical protein